MLKINPLTCRYFCDVCYWAEVPRPISVTGITLHQNHIVPDEGIDCALITSWGTRDVPDKCLELGAHCPCWAQTPGPSTSMRCPLLHRKWGRNCICHVLFKFTCWKSPFYAVSQNDQCMLNLQRLSTPSLYSQAPQRSAFPRNPTMMPAQLNPIPSSPQKIHISQ